MCHWLNEGMSTPAMYDDGHVPENEIMEESEDIEKLR